MLKTVCGRSGLSRRPGLSFKEIAIIADHVMRNKT
jgi:hypothetical protein